MDIRVTPPLSEYEATTLRDALRHALDVEHRFRQLLDAAPDAIVVVDQEGRIVLVNVQTERLFGYGRDELLGQAVEILVPTALRAGHVSRRDHFIDKPTVRPMGTGMDLSGRRKDGTEVPIEISLSPVKTDEGMFVSAAIRDTTERRQAQAALRAAHDELERRVEERTAELEAANRALQGEIADRHQTEKALHQAQKMEAVGQLTGGIAHDFNNLLTVVTGNLQILAAQLKGDELASELIKAGLKAARRGAELNRTLLAFSRRQRLAPVPVDVNDMTRGLTDMLGRTLGETIEIALRPAATLPLALADPSQLEAALLNLAVNARDAMPDGGKLIIETAAATFDAHSAALEGDLAAGSYVMLAVSDTGTGMPPEVVARAFEPFFTTKEMGHGSGLGLAMVYGFVKQSGGHVKIYSEPGLGTTVKIFLPELKDDSEAPGAPPVEQTAEQPRGTETVLVVEDQEDVRTLVCRLLSGLGYTVLEAGDARTALAMLGSDPSIGLLFTDVVLPGGMTGPELVRQARAQIPSLRVLFTSGYTGNALERISQSDAELHLISKPYAIEELAAKIRLALDTPA
jgi:PAS domain S-box-containing protein